MFVSPLFFVQHTDEESDADSFQTQPWGLPVLQRGFTVSVHGLLSVNKKGMCRPGSFDCTVNLLVLSGELRATEQILNVVTRFHSSA